MSSIRLLRCIGSRGGDRRRSPRTSRRCIWTRCGGCHRPGRPGAVQPARRTRRGAAGPADRGRDDALASCRRGCPSPAPASSPTSGGCATARSSGSRSGCSRARPKAIAADLPPRPAWNEGWQLGTPDLVVQLPQPYTLARAAATSSATSSCRCRSPSSRYVRGDRGAAGQSSRWSTMPSIAFDRTRESRRLDEADPEPGFAGGMFSESARNPREPGARLDARASRRRSNRRSMAWRLEHGQRPGAAAAHDAAGNRRAAIGAAEHRASTSPTCVRRGRRSISSSASKTIDIPAGRAGYAIDDVHAAGRRRRAERSIRTRTTSRRR